MTHPFHPWHERELLFVALRQTWGEDRVFFLDEEGMLKSLPTAWTDAAVPDVVVAIGAGRSPFRCEDLLRLAAMIDHVHRSVVDEPL